MRIAHCSSFGYSIQSSTCFVPSCLSSASVVSHAGCGDTGPGVRRSERIPAEAEASPPGIPPPTDTLELV